MAGLQATPGGGQAPHESKANAALTAFAAALCEGFAVPPSQTGADIEIVRAAALKAGVRIVLYQGD